MKNLVILFQMVLLAGAGGCSELQQRRGFESCCPDSFRAEEVRLNPSFTLLRKSKKDLEYPDRIDVFVALRDQFGDPLKSIGKFRFEIYLYQEKASNDPRGKRFPIKGLQWVDLTEPQLNQEHWDQITHCYRFILQLGEASEDLDQLVLQVTYLNNSGYRLEDMLTLKYAEASEAGSAIVRHP